MKKIQAIRQALNAQFLEREEIIDGMLTALIARENLFMIGHPGTGKSALTSALCSAIGGKHFDYLLTKFTSVDELYGPVSFDGLQKSSFERVTTKKLPEADIAFLDEVFKGSSSILNTLLPIMNERKYNNGTSTMKIPLQVLFAASNEIPESEELAAMYDRFALKYITERLREDSLARNLFTGQAGQGSMPSMTLAELEVEQVAAQKLPIPDDVIDALLAIRREIDHDGMYVSDRKWVQSVKVLKAHAHLNGHSQVEMDDLDILVHMLWTNPETKRQVSKIVSKFNNPIGEKLSKITDAVAEMSQDLDKMTTAQAAEVANKLKKFIGDLKELGNPEKNKKLASAIKDADKLMRAVLTKKLGLSV